MYSNLYKKDMYTNPNISYVFNKPIIEYDMKDAGFSIAQKYGLLKKSEVKKLSSVGKDERTILLGNIQRDRKDVKDGIKDGFVDARHSFFEINKIEDQDIIAIKKDAVFLIGYIEVKKLDEYINFRKKNVYTSYIRLPKLELYYNSDKIDIKGMGDESMLKHEDYMLSFLKQAFRKMEGSDTMSTLNFLRGFMDSYRLLKLDTEYYREFNAQSKFRYKTGDTSDVEYLEDKSLLDINYNFQIIKNLVKIAIIK